MISTILYVPGFAAVLFIAWAFLYAFLHVDKEV